MKYKKTFGRILLWLIVVFWLVGLSREAWIEFHWQALWIVPAELTALVALVKLINWCMDDYYEKDEQ